MSYPPYPNQGPGLPYAPPPDHPRATLSLILGIVTIAIGCPPIAPFAWFIGRRTVREIEASGGALGGRSQAMVGYVIGMVVSIITIVAVVVVGIIAIIAATTSTTT